jgi:cytochrome c
MNKRVGWSIDQNLINEIQQLCSNKKMVSNKAEEIIKIGIHFYKKGSRLSTQVIESTVNKVDCLNEEQTNDKNKSPFLN